MAISHLYASSIPNEDEDAITNTNERIFTDTIERILSMAEGRDGYMSDQDLQALTDLCTRQHEGLRVQSSQGSFQRGSFLGFADVDISWMGQVVEGLQRLIVGASSVDWIQAGYQGIQACKDDDGDLDNFESVGTHWNEWWVVMVDI